MTTPLFALGATGVLLSAGGLLLAFAVLLWLILGRGPRRRRAFRRAQRLLHQGQWQDALALVGAIRGAGRRSTAWQGRVDSLEGECHHAAGDAALKEQRFEDAVRHYADAGKYLSVSATELHAKVVDVMLAEALRLFAAGTSHNEAALALLTRALTIQPASAVALFWQALCRIRDGRLDLAAEALGQAHEAGGKAFLDPPLYLGMVLLRQGKPQEALRHLADANRVDANCPFVPLHMGLALVAAGGDAGLAVRALQRGLGPRGLAKWGQAPQRAWADGMSEDRSYVRRLAAKYPYTCPLNGSELTALVNQGRFALGQAHQRLGQYQEAADVFEALLKDSPPSAPLLRGLGLALAKSERYDQAYKHLRIALELDPKDAATAGYLALCGALGKPTREEDRPRNVAWAVQQVARFETYGDPEWARLASRILAEARALGVPVDAADQLRLCDVLASVFATDPEAAGAYDHLAATFPEASRPEHAWIYCQAACQHGYAGSRDLDLFARTFRDADAARPFYGQRAWDFAAVEYAYLERSAKANPGRFPEELGPHYADRGTSLLLGRSKRLEEAGDPDGALAAAEVLLRLAPTNTLSHDRLARMYHARGDLERAASLLAGWHRLEPTNHLPLVRRAVVEAQRGNAPGCSEVVRAALDATRGPLRAGVAFLGARLALSAAPAEAEALLRECLKDNPEHVEALWLLAALLAARGDRAGLVVLAPSLNRPEVPDARFHYLAAVCHLAAGDFKQVLEACRRAWGEPSLTVECRYLMGWAALSLGDEAAALREWEVVARAPDSPSAAHAQALLGRLRFAQGDYEEAVPWWGGLDVAKRASWGLDEPLRATAFLAGLRALDAGRFDRAAERFREAGQLGLRDRRLGPLVTLALVKAGQGKLFSANGEAAEIKKNGP